MYPILALSAIRMGASATVASLVVGAYSLGRLVGSAWGGGLSARRGAARTATFGLLAMAVTALGCAASTALAPFVVAVVAFGVAYSVFHIARQTQVVALVPHVGRARGLTTLAGVWRIANFIGPVIGAVIIRAHGLRWAYVFAAALIAVAAATMISTAAWVEGRHHVQTEQGSAFTVARENRHVLLTLGVACASTTAVRAARLLALPLWAKHLGMSDGAASEIFAVSAAVDMLLFYPAGLASDRWGRRWSAVPSTALLAIGFLVVPLTTGATGLAVAAVLIGLGNGWGSGLLMTLGADVAPHRSRSVFIGLWMVLGDFGALVGPALVSVVTLIGLAAGIAGIGVLGLGSTALLYKWIPPGRVHDQALGAEP